MAQMKLKSIYFRICLIALVILPIYGTAQKKPNILLFLVDDMGLMDTSVPFLTDKNGNPQKHPLNDWYRTPNMERLAKLGTRFSTFYAQSVCSPSRASLLTGQNAARHRTTQWIKPSENNRGEFGPMDWNWKGLKTADNATLPKVLKDDGYRTIFLGKAHFGPLGSEGENPLNLGFDVNVGGGSWGQPGSYLGMDNYKRTKIKPGILDYQVPNLEKYHGTETFLTEALTLEAKEEIKKAVKSKEPFFLEMSHYALHAPFMTDSRFIENYTSMKYGETEQRFSALVEGMDKSLGDLLDVLNEVGIAENTLVLFVGDNGSDAPIGNMYQVGSSAPLRGKKGTHYEGGMRVPFIAAWAKPDVNNIWQKKLPIVQNAIHEQMGTIMDIYPTILDLLSIETPKKYAVDGFSLGENLKGNRNTKKPEMFLMHFPHQHRSSYFTSYRNGDWKLVYHYYPEMNVEKVKYELFNLSKDPYEQKNLAAVEPAKLKNMVKQMKTRLKKEDALYPIDSSGESMIPFFE